MLAGWGMRTRVFELADGIDRVAFTRALADADVAVDAMFGTGFRGALADDAAWVAEQLAAWDGATCRGRHPVGRRRAHAAWSSGRTVRATRTVTFAARKPGAGVRARAFVRRARSWSPTSASTSGPAPHPGLVTDDDVRGVAPAAGRPTRTSGGRG